VKRLLVLMVVAVLAVWAGVLLDFGGAHRARTHAAAAAPEPAAAPPPKVAFTQVRQRPAPPPVLPRGPQPLAASAPRSAKAVAAAIAQRAIDEGSDLHALKGEHGEGVLSPEYAELERDYVGESRDAAWALPEEMALNKLLRSSPVGKQLALVNCIERTCRIVLETDANDAFERLLAVPGLAQATGLSAATPYSLRAGQLSVYLRRRQ
jgi:hypothetical protein